MTIGGAGDHILVFPYPAQGHMIPLLDLTHQLAIRGLTITVLVTPKNLPLLDPLLSEHESVATLVLPFPVHPSIPAGVENVKDLPVGGFRAMMVALGELHDPLLRWFQNQPSPPKAILSDMFLGWTHHLARRLGIRRFVFSPSGSMALSVIYSLWREFPRRRDSNDYNEKFSFPKIPNSPIYPWWQLSPIFRSYVAGDPDSEFIKDGFLANIASWGLVINSVSELERVYLEYLKGELGHDRVWTVGPLLPPDGDLSRTVERGGSSSVLTNQISSWLDKCNDRTVVYVCFGSQAVLSNDQMEHLASGLEKSGSKFVWSVKGATTGQEKGSCGQVPLGFEESVGARGLVIRGWAPQLLILNHRAVGAFLTHCGWNSLLEGLIAGVPMLAWPMGADQFANASLLVDELRVAIRLCEGAQVVPSSNELARLVTEATGGDWPERGRAEELRKVALGAIKDVGSSFNNLNDLVRHISEIV